MAPPPVASGMDGVGGTPDMERDSSGWKILVRPEHASGLSVKARYLRGPSKDVQARTMGLPANHASLVVLQIRSQNLTNGSIRRLRVLQRSSSTGSGSTIGPRKVSLPLEIPELKKDQVVESVLAIDFASTSDREGSMLAKLDVKFGSGGIPVEIKPSLGDILLPSTISPTQFDQAIARLHGFQRLDSTIDLQTNISGGDLARQLQKLAALTNVDVGDDSPQSIKLAGVLPASSDSVYVLVEGNTNKKVLIVCSENALAVNSIMNGLKRGIQSGIAD